MKTTIKLIGVLVILIGCIFPNQASAQGCGVPSGLSVTVVSTTSTQLNWNAIPGATQYNIEIQNATGNNVPFLQTANATTNTFTVNNLTAGSNYKFKVRTRCGGTKSNWSPYYFFTSGSGQTQCSLPSGITVSNTTATSATVSWGAAAGALSYRLRVEDGQNNPVAFLFAVSTAQTSYTVTGLTAATNYKAKLRSNCGGLLHSAWTAWTPFTTAAQRITDLPEANVQLFPNPANEVVYLVLPDEWTNDLSEVTMTDMTGKVVYSFKAQNSTESAQFEVPVNDFPQGIYILSVKAGADEHHQRLSIVH